MTVPPTPLRSEKSQLVGHAHGVLQTVDEAQGTASVVWSDGSSGEVSSQELGLQSSSDLWAGARIARVHLSHLGITTPLWILEPEYLVDVTEVANTMSGRQPAPRTSLLQRLQEHRTTMPMVAGTALNTAFDLMVAHPDRSDADIVTQAVTSRPLSLAVLANDGLSLHELEARALASVPAMRAAINNWQPSEIIVEPYVLSPLIGLQGRFDILVSDGDGQEIIEMKGGSPPRSGVRPSHGIQAACYALSLCSRTRIVATANVGLVRYR